MSIAENLAKIQAEISQYATQFHRDANSIHLLAVSKTQPVSIIQEAYNAGQRHFGENYLQEALEKIKKFSCQPEITEDEPQQPANKISSLHNGISDQIQWHFIGPIQSNKTRDIAEHFSWVHSVDRIKIAERLSLQRTRALPALKIFLQVNLDNEISKSGFIETEILEAARHISSLPQLELQGLMIIPAPRRDFNEQHAIFAKLLELQNKLIANGIPLKQISMGMSEDFKAAIAQGSNWLRIGSAIFGKRASK